MSNESNRRQFLGGAAATAFTIVPRHVLGGPMYVPPSDKVTLAYIGTGTQGLREMVPLLAVPELQIVAVCDPCKEPVGYRDWNRDGLQNSIRRALKKPNWGRDGVIPGGLDVGQDIVNSYYANQRSGEKFKGCAAYADYREMLEKEKDVMAVKVITPDHLHGVASIAAMKKGKHVMMHKPIANRLKEAKLVIDTAKQTGVATHFLPWDSNGSMEQVLGWIREGAIGTLREVHNWSNRPVWPQYPTLPAETPPVPDGFNWDLWLGPETERPYHPNYTHMVFRGWYDFGGGSMADMGHYSLWTVYNALQLGGPTVVEPMFSAHAVLKDGVSTKVKNDFSFPDASIVRFKYPARGERPAIDLYWYEGGMRPATPAEVEEDGKDLPAEGMMFVGDKGKILGGFRVEAPRLIPESRMRGRNVPEQRERRQREMGEVAPNIKKWLAACKGAKEHSAGSFTNAWPISEAVNLYALALRTGRKLNYDAQKMEITNFAEANKLLSREYRKGWEPATT